MCAYKKIGGDYAEAARAEAIRMRDEINEYIVNSFQKIGQRHSR
jgi:hypothetical protein